MLIARKDLLIHRAGDVWVVLDPLNDAAHTLNPAAYWVLHHTDGQATPAVLAATLSGLAQITPAQAEADIIAAHQHLRGLNLLSEA